LKKGHNKKPMNKHSLEFEAIHQRIIAVTFRLLKGHLSSDVAMKDIAKAARISRQTLYKHFNSIGDIILEIKKSFDREIIASVASRTSLVKENGREKVVGIATALFSLEQQNPDKFIFLSRFGDFENTKGVSLYYQDLFYKNLGIDAIFQEGIADGSIRPDLDPYKSSLSLASQMIALSFRMANLQPQVDLGGHHYSGVEIEDEFIAELDYLLKP
jgi:AcrR family transcriptional regulator